MIFLDPLRIGQLPECIQEVMMIRQTGIIFPAFFLFAAFTVLSSCGSSGSTTSGNKLALSSAKLIKPADSTDLEKRLKDELIRRYERQYAGCTYSGGYSRSGGGATGLADGGTAVSGQNSEGTPQANAPVRYSETNNQEPGVDEGDLVKTDGSLIYLARGSRFLILRATPAAQTSIISDTDLKLPISEIHLSAGRIAIVSGAFVPYPVASTSASLPQYAKPATHVQLYDVTVPASPLLTATYVFPGAYQGSRRINDRLYVVTNYSIDLASPAAIQDYLVSGASDADSLSSACRQAQEENIRRIQALTIDDLLPEYTRTFGSDSSRALAVTYNDVYFPESGNGTDLSLVISLDISQETPEIASSGVISSWCRIYMNTESLYLASQNNWLWIQPMAGQTVPGGNPEPQTAVHKFSINGSVAKPVYRGSGVVDGWLNDRFSMSEYQGHLRIGTTRGGWWGETISNQLTVLAEDGDGLAVKGKIAGLAKSERIYAMRFDRDRGYMVTFRQTDPLFTLDLSDPAEPRVAGEIKVNGFSTYIHLVGPDNTRLLTIGPAADDTGRMTGDNKLQLFDVSDLSNPSLLAAVSLGQGWSNAVYDPHAFLYYQGLLTIPYFGFGYPNSGGYGGPAYQAGLYVFEIGVSGIAKRGVIEAPAITTGYGNYQDTVDRAVIIEGNIFSIAHRSVTVAGAADLEIIKTITLPESYAYYYPASGVGIAPGGIGAGTAESASVAGS